jgi:hypothetical protein
LQSKVQGQKDACSATQGAKKTSHQSEKRRYSDRHTLSDPPRWCKRKQQPCWHDDDLRCEELFIRERDPLDRHCGVHVAMLKEVHETSRRGEEEDAMNMGARQVPNAQRPSSQCG